MQRTGSRPGPAYARKGGSKGTGGSQHGSRTQGVQRIDRGSRDARSEPRFDGASRPSRRPPYQDRIKGSRPEYGIQNNGPVNTGRSQRQGARPVKRDNFDQRTRGPRAAAVASSTSWENVAEWYGTHLSAPGTYQSEIIWPSALRLLGVHAGQNILDIACGEGTFAQMIAKQGAKVMGIDASPTLVRQAQVKGIKNADFIVADAERFAHQFDGSVAGSIKQMFDGAAMILALQNVANMNGVFAHAAKILNKNAPFVIVLNHPAFRVPRQSSWGFEDERKMMYRRIDSYLSDMDIPMLMNPGSANSEKTMSFHRPISAYITALAANGFVIDAMEEWTSHKESTSGPRAKAENRIRKEIPMFLAIRARKV